jgi:anti-sigma-K factor RskA
MIPEKEIFEELSAAYALGALEEEELALFEEGLNNGGDEYKKIVVESLGVSYLLNSSVKRIPPSMRAKAQLMKKILRGKNKSLSLSYFFEQSALLFGFGNPKFGLLVSLLLLIVILEVGAYAYLLYHDVEQREPQQTITDTLYHDTQPQHSLLFEEILTVLRSPNIITISLHGSDLNSSASGNIIWDPLSMQAIIQLSKLPPLPTDKVYQLWYLDKNNAVKSISVIALETETHQFVSVIKMPVALQAMEVSSFKITMEPKNGSVQPTGETYLQGVIPVIQQ